MMRVQHGGKLRFGLVLLTWLLLTDRSAVAADGKSPVLRLAPSLESEVDVSHGAAFVSGSSSTPLGRFGAVVHLLNEGERSENGPSPREVAPSLLEPDPRDLAREADRRARAKLSKHLDRVLEASAVKETYREVKKLAQDADRLVTVPVADSGTILSSGSQAELSAGLDVERGIAPVLHVGDFVSAVARPWRQEVSLQVKFDF